MIQQIVIGGVSNACIAAILALLAIAVGAKAQRPQLAHLLWILVLAKLVTPPFVLLKFDFPIPPLAPSIADQQATATLNAPLRDGPLPTSWASSAAEIFIGATPWLAAAWLAGSFVVLVVSLRRAWRFGRFLGSHTQAAGPELTAEAREIGQRLGLRFHPELLTTAARVSPLVWWSGRRVQVVFPAFLPSELGSRRRYWVLAHELAHVKRGDHVVRWLEWLARVLCWWNPLVWWAQRSLRAHEEVCCDDLVIATFRPHPRAYADSILTAIESLTESVIRPPAQASAINSGGSLERRFTMMVTRRSDRLESRSRRTIVLLAALFVLPMGLTYAQDYKAVKKRLRSAVEAGEISGKQARRMMRALKGDDAPREQPEGIAGAYYAEVEARLDALIEKGEISPKEARKKLDALRKKMATEHRDRREAQFSREEYAEAERKIMQMVEDGEATEEHARIRLGEMRRMMERTLAKNEDQHDPVEIDWGAVKDRIEGAVQKGVMSREEAEDVYRGIKRRSAIFKRSSEVRKVEDILRKTKRSSAEPQGSDRRPRFDLEAVRRRIEESVGRGEITLEEASKKYEDIQERLELEAVAE